jgi:uncharacterized protein (TIGR02302 family)
MRIKRGNKGDNETDRLLRRLGSRRLAARAVILFERLWPALWPPLGVAGVFACAALLDLPRLIPPWLHLLALAVFVVVELTLLVRGIARVAAPDNAAADRRLELVSGLPHRPLAALTDRPAGEDAVAAALWRTHVARAARAVRHLRVGLPHPGLARHDRRALRAAVIVGLAASLVIAGDDAPARLVQGLLPAQPRAIAKPAIELQAWITPPAYTKLAPVFLTNAGGIRQAGGTVSVPAGSRLTVSVTGGTSVPSLTLDADSMPFRALDQTSFQAERDLTAGGRLSVRRDGVEMAGWVLTVIADRPPRAAWTSPPGPSPRGPQLRLPWSVNDDYGVVSLEADLTLVPRPDLPPLRLPIQLPAGEPASAHGVAIQDLSASPWAGLPVQGKLIARDALGQSGESDIAAFVLPQRVFQNPIARALVAMRRGLSLHPENRDDALAGLDQLLLAPQAFAGDMGGFLNLADIYSRLARDPVSSAIPDVQRQMWELALRLEDGLADRTARALDAADRAARDALDQAMRQPDAANMADLDRKLKELEDAIERHLQAMIEQAHRDGTEEELDASAAQMDAREMERMAEAAREAARAGKMDEARKRMAELEQMLERLRDARAGNPQAAQRNAERRQRGQKQMSAVQDMIARQGGLEDHAQRRGNDAPSTRRPDEPPAPGDRNDAEHGAEHQADRQADRQVQQALRRALGELMQQFGDLTGEVPSSLPDADQAMRDAAQALADGQDGPAGAAEQRAIEALQKGGQEMGRTMARQFGPAQIGPGGNPGEDGADGTAQGEGRDGRGDGNGRSGDQLGSGSGRDPLGRMQGQGSAGADENDDVHVPEERERQRAQAIQEELRRRAAERGRPQEELDYIDRLLRQF